MPVKLASNSSSLTTAARKRVVEVHLPAAETLDNEEVVELPEDNQRKAEGAEAAGSMVNGLTARP